MQYKGENPLPLFANDLLPVTHVDLNQVGGTFPTDSTNLDRICALLMDTYLYKHGEKQDEELFLRHSLDTLFPSRDLPAQREFVKYLLPRLRMKYEAVFTKKN
jgi:hypothetical protein